MSLENDLKKNIENFMQNQVVLMPENIPTGPQKVSFESQGEHACLLIKKKSGVKADCLQPLPNQRNRYQLTGKSDYFFTPNMNGCQLAIYKLANGQTWVEHHNDFDEHHTFHEYIIQIDQLHPVKSYIFTPDEHYDPMKGLMAIGQRTPKGWCLWIRSNVAANEGPVVSFNVW